MKLALKLRSRINNVRVTFFLYNERIPFKEKQREERNKRIKLRNLVAEGNIVVFKGDEGAELVKRGVAKTRRNE